MPQGQFSKVFGFAPQMVQVSRSRSAFARALRSSYSIFFFNNSGSMCVCGRREILGVEERDGVALCRLSGFDVRGSRALCVLSTLEPRSPVAEQSCSLEASLAHR